MKDSYPTKVTPVRVSTIYGWRLGLLLPREEGFAPGEYRIAVFGRIMSFDRDEFRIIRKKKEPRG